MSNPNDKVDHSSKAPLKSDMKAGVQPNQQPGVKIPIKTRRTIRKRARALQAPARARAIADRCSREMAAGSARGWRLLCRSGASAVSLAFKQAVQDFLDNSPGLPATPGAA